MMKAKNPRRPAVLSAGSRHQGGVQDRARLGVFAPACGASSGSGPHLEISASTCGALPKGDSMSLEVRMDTSRAASPPRRIRNTELRETCYEVGHAWERWTPLLMRCILCRLKWKRPDLTLLP